MTHPTSDAMDIIQRPEITDDWRSWSRGRLAAALEAHIIPREDWEKHFATGRVPQDVIEALSEPYPQSLALHEKTGYAFLFCGQGSCVGWIEFEAGL